MTSSSVGTFAGVVGQPRAVKVLERAAGKPVHAYLIVGGPGTGKRAAATGFAAALLCPETARGEAADGTCDTCRRVLAGVHPDVVQVERHGPAIDMDTARQVTRLAGTSPLEGDRRVVVLHDFHLVRDTGPALLKTIEEPPPSTIFLILAEHVPAELATIASRCARVDLDPLPPELVAGALEADGVPPGRAAAIAAASGGSLARARLLEADEGFESRRRAWSELPGRLDGTGATAAALAGELLALVEAGAEGLRARQAVEISQLSGGEANLVKGPGSSRRSSSKPAAGPGLRELQERHRREERRQRTDELRVGLASLASAYRERMAADPRRSGDLVRAVGRIDQASRDLAFNPGELLALQALLVSLGQIRTRS